MPRYLATLKNGDQILTNAESVQEARACLRTRYQIREWSFPIVPDPQAAARDQFLEMLEQGDRLFTRYRHAIDQSQLADLDEDRNRLVTQLEGLGKPDEGSS
jgi:hypothetical protein